MNKLSFQQLVKVLDEGEMLSNPVVKYLVEVATATGDEGSLRAHLNTHPIFLAMAYRNIRLKKYQTLKNPFPIPTQNDAKEFLLGPIKLGKINGYNDKFGIDPNEFCKPVILAGRVGAGKSVLIKGVLDQMIGHKQSFNLIIPDLKSEYRHLLSRTDNLKVIKNDYLRFNPLQVPDWMTPREYIIFFSKLFVSENYLAGTSQNLLISTLEYIYKERGIFNGSKNWPTLRDLNNVIKAMQSRHQSFKYRDILLWIQNRLDPYVFSGKFDQRSGIPLEVWRDENIVLEVDEGFSDQMYSFVVSYLVGLRYTYNKKNGLIGSKLRTLFITDEGRILFNSKRDISTFGESYITEVITKIREFGIGMWVASQETASFNQTLRSISGLKLCFPLTDGADLKFIEESFGLNKDQKEFLFKLPQFGQAVVRYSGYPKPFLLDVPPFQTGMVSDSEIDEKMVDFYSNIFKPEPPIALVVEKKESMPANAARLLYFLGKQPYTKVSQMTGASGFNSPAQVTTVLKWLEANGYVTRQSIKVARRGRYSKFAILSDKAIAYLGATNMKGKGSFEHGLYQHLVSQKLSEKGWQVTVEGKIGRSKKLIDVLAQSQDQGRLAYEISLHLDNIISNITQDLQSGADSVVIVTRDEKDRKNALAMVQADSGFPDYADRVTFRTIIELIG